MRMIPVLGFRIWGFGFRFSVVSLWGLMWVVPRLLLELVSGDGALAQSQLAGMWFRVQRFRAHGSGFRAFGCHVQPFRF